MQEEIKNEIKVANVAKVVTEGVIGKAQNDCTTDVIVKKSKKAVNVSKAKKLLKIRFLLSPTGKFNLAYNIGEVAVFNDLQASALVESGFAELV
jgi:hypothetical protein